VIRVVQLLLTAVLLLVALVLWMTAHAVAAGVLLGIALVSVAVRLLLRRRDRHLASARPEELERLAWWSSETAVAFMWRFRRGRETRVSITRSEQGPAGSSGDAGHDRLVVFDAVGDRAVDRDVLPRRTYVYSISVVRAADVPAVVRLEIPTLSPKDRAAIDATLSPSAGPLPSAFTPEVSRDGACYGGIGYQTIGAAAAAGDILGGFATDALFAVADVFLRDRPPDGWVEVT